MGRYGDDVNAVTRWRTRTQKELHRPLAEAVGAKTAKAFSALHVGTVGEALGHLPRRYLTGTETTDLSHLVIDTEVALVADVVGVEVHTNKTVTGRERRPRQRLEVMLSDGKARLPVTFFGKPHIVSYWQRIFSAHTHGIFVGKVGEFRGNPQLVHPDFVMIDRNGKVVAGREEGKVMAAQVQRHGLLGLYPQTSKLRTWEIASVESMLLESTPELEDTLPEWLRQEADLPSLWEAYHAIHYPHSVAEADRGAERLIWEEAIATQVTMAVRRRSAERHDAPVCSRRDGGLLVAFEDRLPFTPTVGQDEVSRVIDADLSADRPMHRLLQGEVGSGKTFVALRAMLQVVDAGHQAVLLAPTEVLAQQHYRTIINMLGDLASGEGLDAPEISTGVALLTGSMKAAGTRAALADIASGAAGIIVGTHSLLSGRVIYNDIGLVVVDEQHRFGVEQRSVLTTGEGARPHELVLTATPIPRTVAMTVFGDLEVSSLRELPTGRADVQTTVVDLPAHGSWLTRAWQRIREECDAGHQVFVVCPRINSDDADDVEGGRPPAAAVEELAPQLATGPLAGLRVEALHSRLDLSEKDLVMDRFIKGESQVLISTTVIEVGVDVPNATMMVIMDADRFGVSQLHQLRGRIGRGNLPGLCLLVTTAPPGSVARERLDAVAASRDGFELAELDLAQRHEGNVLGSSQAGYSSPLRLLRVLDHAEIVTASKDLAERWVAEAPDDPRLLDVVTATEMLAEGDLMEQG